MHKHIIPMGEPVQSTPADEWMDLEAAAVVEITSEDPDHPIEAALIPGRGQGWRAAGPGAQTVRLRFGRPVRVRRVWLHFAEPAVARTQEFVLRVTTAAGKPAGDIVRQQWTFSPGGSTQETEDYKVDLRDVAIIELSMIPDISGGDTRASLAEFRVA